MIKDGKYGANTQTGIVYEGDVDLYSFIIKQKNYSGKIWNEMSGSGNSKAYKIFFNNKEIAQIFKKNTIYNFLNKKYNIDWENLISKKLLPDDSIFVFNNNTFFVIEIKSQQVAGSVDEKLQTCDFKKKQWQKILGRLNCKVEYFYLLNEWFMKDEYKDVLNYIIDVGCRYFFQYIPLSELGLPIPSNK